MYTSWKSVILRMILHGVGRKIWLQWKFVLYEQRAKGFSKKNMFILKSLLILETFHFISDPITIWPRLFIIFNFWWEALEGYKKWFLRLYQRRTSYQQYILYVLRQVVRKQSRSYFQSIFCKNAISKALWAASSEKYCTSGFSQIQTVPFSRRLPLLSQNSIAIQTSLKFSEKNACLSLSHHY